MRMSYCLVFVGVWEGWRGNGFFATARYPCESYSRYASDFFIMMKLVISLNHHQCKLALLLHCFVCVCLWVCVWKVLFYSNKISSDSWFFRINFVSHFITWFPFHYIYSSQSIILTLNSVYMSWWVWNTHYSFVNIVGMNMTV